MKPALIIVAAIAVLVGFVFGIGRLNQAQYEREIADAQAQAESRSRVEECRQMLEQLAAGDRRSAEARFGKYTDQAAELCDTLIRLDAISTE